MNVFRRDASLSDLADHAFYLGQDDPGIAERFIEAFEAAAERLSQMPFVGATYPTGNPALFGLRRWPIKGFEKYLIFYLVFEDAIDIVRIVHSARDLERLLTEED